MRKIIFGIFAHPDDEAFGPAGALLLESKSGAQLHLISFTDGGGGTNPDNLPNLGRVRLEEWRQAGGLLGAKSMHHLGYQDGELGNKILLEGAERITKIVKEAISNAPRDTQIEFMTFSTNGLTGHIDHIVAARSACLVFYMLQKTDERFKKIRFFCLPHEFYPRANTDWLYMEPGPKEVDETIDARPLRADILKVMRAHHTQRGDARYHIELLGERLGLNHFIVSSSLADQEF